MYHLEPKWDEVKRRFLSNDRHSTFFQFFSWNSSCATEPEYYYYSSGGKPLNQQKLTLTFTQMQTYINILYGYNYAQFFEQAVSISSSILSPNRDEIEWVSLTGGATYVQQV